MNIVFNISKLELGDLNKVHSKVPHVLVGHTEPHQSTIMVYRNMINSTY